MDIEQLKLILSTVESVSGTAGDVAMYWVIGQFLLPFISDILTVSLWVGLIGFVVWKITTMFSLMNEWAVIGQRLVEAQLGYQTSGHLNMAAKDAVMRIMDMILAAKPQKPY